MQKKRTSKSTTASKHLKARSLETASEATARSSKTSKTQACLDLLDRKTGAALSELMAATSWQAHSVRGFLSGTVKKKLGHSIITSRDRDGGRRYRIDRAGR
jgi:hypothetical protein